MFKYIMGILCFGLIFYGGGVLYLDVLSFSD